MTVIIQVSDIHVGGGHQRGVTDDELLAMLINSINERDPDAIVVTGDITYGVMPSQYIVLYNLAMRYGRSLWDNLFHERFAAPSLNGVRIPRMITPHESEFKVAKRWLERLNAPLFTVPGNHDWFTKSSIYGAGLFSRSMYDDYFSEYDISCKSVQVGPLTIIGVDTGYPQNTFFDMAGTGMTDEDFDRFKQLVVNSERPVLAISHHPPIASLSSAYHGRQDCTFIGNRARAMNVFEAHDNPICWLSGHTHRSEMKDRNGVRYIQTPDYINTHQYAILTIGDDLSRSYETVIVQ